MKTFTQRLEDDKSVELTIMSAKLGMSQNSLINAFISLGLEAYNDIVNDYREKFSDFLLQFEQYTAQQEVPVQH
jgi:hypothetical protein